MVSSLPKLLRSSSKSRREGCRKMMPLMAPTGDALGDALGDAHELRVLVGRGEAGDGRRKDVRR